MPSASSKRPTREKKVTKTLGRAELAAEFLKRNRSYRAEHAQMRQRIERGSTSAEVAEADFARRWGLSFRLCAG